VNRGSLPVSAAVGGGLTRARETSGVARIGKRPQTCVPRHLHSSRKTEDGSVVPLAGFQPSLSEEAIDAAGADVALRLELTRAPPLW
jgi:hypothetical protein